MSVFLLSLALTAVGLTLGITIPRVIQQELRKLEAFYPTLAHRSPMTADEIAAATGAMAVMRRFLIDAIEEAADAGRIERRPPFPGQRQPRYTVRKLRPQPGRG
jgi:hypothetical protein